MLVGLRSNRGNGLFSPVLKHKADGRGGISELTTKTRWTKPSTAVKANQGDCMWDTIYDYNKVNHVTQSGHAHAWVCCGVVVHAQALS